MKQLNYEKPAMKLVSLRNEKTIASGNCWSDAASNTPEWWYYDYNDGELGYLQFKMDSNCSGSEGSMHTVQYMPEEVGMTDAAIAAEAYLKDNLKTTVKQGFFQIGITDDPTQVS